MLTLNHSGWNKDYGPYEFNIPFDDSRTDWEIHFPDGDVYRQGTPFQEETRDWNADHHVYTQHGAWFYCSESSRGEFFTPQGMLRLVVDGEAIVPGLPDPAVPIKEHLERLAEQKLRNEADRKRAWPVSVTDERGREVTVLFDATESYYRMHLATGKSYFQTSDFEERPERWVNRGVTSAPIFGAWFQSNTETLEACFFTPKEMVQMVVDKKAVIEGFDLEAQMMERSQPAHGRTATTKRRSREAER